MLYNVTFRITNTGAYEIRLNSSSLVIRLLFRAQTHYYKIVDGYRTRHEFTTPQAAIYEACSHYNALVPKLTKLDVRLLLNYLTHYMMRKIRMEFTRLKNEPNQIVLYHLLDPALKSDIISYTISFKFKTGICMCTTKINARKRMEYTERKRYSNIELLVRQVLANVGGKEVS